MDPEREFLRHESRDLPAFTRLVAGVPEATIDQMRGNIKLRIAIEGAKYPWDDQAACQQISERFPDYEDHEIGALAKRLELEKGDPTKH